MNSEKKTEIKVGATVLIGIILFVFVYGWAKNFSFSSDNNYLNISFPTVAGLEIGDLVSVNGVRRGLVEKIESSSNRALVKIKFNDEVALKEDATFSIMMLDLMGGKKIEISGGSSPNSLDYSQIHSGKFAGDISTAMATLNSVESDLVDVIGELKISLKSANSIFGSKDFTDNVSGSLKNVEILTKNLNDLILENKEMLSQSITNTRDLTEKTNSFLDENTKQISSVISNLDSTLVNSNKLIRKISAFSDEIKSSENNLGKILYDEALLSDLQNSLKQIQEMTTIINEQLKSGGLEVKADVDLF